MRYESVGCVKKSAPAYQGTILNVTKTPRSWSATLGFCLNDFTKTAEFHNLPAKSWTLQLTEMSLGWFGMGLRIMADTSEVLMRRAAFVFGCTSGRDARWRRFGQGVAWPCIRARTNNIHQLNVRARAEWKEHLCCICHANCIFVQNK